MVICENMWKLMEHYITYAIWLEIFPSCFLHEIQNSNSMCHLKYSKFKVSSI